jgi:peptide/nickel transport system substrate-binding protein
LYALFSSKNIGGNFNWSCYSNAEVDRLLAQGRMEADLAKRRGVYLRLEQTLLEQAVSVPLVDELSVWVMRGNVKGVKYNYSAYPILSDTYLER